MEEDGGFLRQTSAKEAQASFAMYNAIAVAMTGAAMFGFDQGNFGNVQVFEGFREQWCIGHFGNATSCSEEGVLHNAGWESVFLEWAGTLIPVGAAAGALFLGPMIINRCGRKPCIATGGGITLFGCLMASYVSFSNVAVFMVGRFITGFGVGVSCFALPLYNAEVSTPSIRGMTGSLFQLNVVVGCFISCIVTLFFKNWQFGMVLPGLAGGVLLIGSFFIPESPRYVMEKHGYEKGVECLQRVRSGDVTLEAQEILKQVEEEKGIKHVSLTGLFKERNLRKRVIIACTLVIGQQATGVNAFLGYAATLFKQCGIDSPILFNAIFNSIMIFACIAGLLMVDSKYGGRRKQLLWATYAMGPPLVIAGFALQFMGNSEAEGGHNQLQGLITMACVIIYGCGFQFAWGTIPWIYPAEIFSMTEKESAVSLAVAINYVANAAVVAITPVLMHWSVPGTLWFFGALNILNWFFVATFIEETKGVPLELIPELFKSKRNTDYDFEYSTDEGSASDSESVQR